MRLNLLFIALMLFVAGVVHAKSEPLPTYMKPVGQAELKVLWFSVYNATLASPEGLFTSVSEPLLLTLKYKRNISRQDLLDETENQWKQAGVQEENYDIWLFKLKAIWPDISEGDSLAFYQDGEGNGYFYFNNEPIGSLEDKDFSQAFLNIWLSDKSDFPRFTKALTGKSGD